MSVIVRAMNILSIQSHVAYGHVGNSAAVFPLPADGRRGVADPHRAILQPHRLRPMAGPGLRCRADPRTGRRASSSAACSANATACCRAIWAGPISARPFSTRWRPSSAPIRRRAYCCDPVIGDVGRGVFVREGIAEFMKEKAVPAADIVTPNQFELDYLTGRESRTLADALAAIKAVHGLGPRAVLVTSLHSRTRRRTPSTCSPRTRPAAIACARRGCLWR